MEIVRGLSVQLRAAEEAVGSAVSFAAVVEAANVFAKLSRAIRLIVLLEMKADEALRALLGGRPAPRAAAGRAPPPDELAPEPTAEAELAAELQQEAAPETESAAETERLVERDASAITLDCYDDIRAAARERLFLDRNYADFLTRPLEQLVPDLCRDLGLTAHRRRHAGRAAGRETAPPPPER